MLPLLFVYVLILAELFIRFFSPVVLTPRYVVNSGYGIRGNWPSISYTHYSQEYGQIYFQVNSKGVRSSREIAYNKPENTFRVLALGDSFTIGYGAQEDQTYLTQMELALSEKTSCTIEVINLGVSGHGTAEELVALQREGYKYQPDVVLVQWHSSDLKENIRSGLFRMENGNLVKRREQYLPAVGIREKLFQFSAYRYLAANSMFYSWIRKQASRFLKQWMDKSILKDANGSEDNNNLVVNQQRNTLMEDLSVNILNKIQEEVHHIGAQFLILDVPRRLDRSNFESSFPQNSGLESIVYNPTQDFHEYNGEILYWEESAGHFSILGNKVVGRGLANMIETECTDNE